MGYLSLQSGFGLLLSLIIGSFHFTHSLSAQSCNLTIKGRVINAETGEPIPYANIIIRSENIGTVSDDQGNYVLTDLCAGDYTVVCSRIDCDHAEHHLSVENGAVLVQDFRLQPNSIELGTVEVTGEAVHLHSISGEDQLNQAEMAGTQGINLGESLEKLPGVNTLKTGSSIAKPVVQGMSGQRILIMNNGVRLEGQQWGLEHAPEIDPFVAEKLTVIKGAGGLRYGADALGGVILVEPKALPTAGGLHGVVNLAGFSQGRTGLASGILETSVGKKLPISARIQGTVKRGGNMRTPDYFLENTGLEEYNYSWALGTKKETWSAELYYSSFFSKLGIFSGAHIGNLTDLQNAIEREEPLQTGDFTYELGRPLQRIAHELFKAKFGLKTGNIGTLSLQYARQFNRRQEFDAHSGYGTPPESLDDPEIEFEVTTHSSEIDWEHKPIGNLRGHIGAQLISQVNTTDRGALIPNYENLTAGVYWIERWRHYPSPFELEGGLRYDIRQMDVGMQGRDSIGQSLDFANFSGALGLIFKQPAWRARLSVGTAWRAPHVNELYSDGVHHGSASFESGNASLTQERALNTSLGFDWQPENRPFRAGLNLYYNQISNYIFLEPSAEPVLTIRGAFPAFEYQQADARIMGLDARASWDLNGQLQWSAQTSLLRGWNRDLEDHLVFMPADRVSTALRYQFGTKEAASNAPFIRLNASQVFRQSRTPAKGDYAPAPPAYLLLDLEAGTTLNLGRQPVELGLSVFNLMNTRYREYLNRFRYFADEIGRNVSLRIKVPF
ncbi:TonB-dependent receptor [Flavilitoribacter nigricans]|uniref:TonB-dependent receptor n=1 Tax=Flavilitoribacter nigricans (strain ATCC 23147 / DSM 23189 / NBRC 102662 / NCIMB 1420 / SS-2) TaxID=1122177 RepID=A0A2D0N2B3_FLAN2|nr:TonB-dependent receptor [Flavilitoribacter nigricans]PHN02644.1 TonB-dependent receptor [Flavilitoribacter nigricans DSM 23189 = NBRC 102662]